VTVVLAPASELYLGAPASAVLAALGGTLELRLAGAPASE
jgi:hypothetical protein